MTDERYMITAAMPVDASTLWDSVTGCGAESLPWYRAIRTPWDDWETPGNLIVTAFDPDDEDRSITRTLTLADIAAAWETVIAGRHYHCGTRIGFTSIEDGDQCTADTVLQVALYGRVLFA